jgi:hypothetical protein
MKYTVVMGLGSRHTKFCVGLGVQIPVAGGGYRRATQDRNLISILLFPLIKILVNTLRLVFSEGDLETAELILT